MEWPLLSRAVGWLCLLHPPARARSELCSFSSRGVWTTCPPLPGSTIINSPVFCFALLGFTWISLVLVWVLFGLGVKWRWKENFMLQLHRKNLCKLLLHRFSAWSSLMMYFSQVVHLFIFWRPSMVIYASDRRKQDGKPWFACVPRPYWDSFSLSSNCALWQWGNYSGPQKWEWSTWLYNQVEKKGIEDYEVVRYNRCQETFEPLGKMFHQPTRPKAMYNEAIVNSTSIAHHKWRIPVSPYQSGLSASCWIHDCSECLLS